MSQESAQQPIGEPTTPTPYPDGLVLHQVDGPTIYPEAYTGVRSVEPTDEWYHLFGFYYDPSLDYPEHAMWGWWGTGLSTYDPPSIFFNLPAFCFFVGPLLLPILIWKRPQLLRPFASLAAWSGVFIVALLVAFDDGDMDGARFVPSILLIAALLLFLARPARSFRRGVLRYAAFSVLFCYPNVVLAALDRTDWLRSDLVLSIFAWIALFPLAVAPEAEASKPERSTTRDGWAVLAGMLPITAWLIDEELGVGDLREFGPWAVLMFSLIIYVSYLSTRTRRPSPTPAT